jgi:hypothetical protein
MCLNAQSRVTHCQSDFISNIVSLRRCVIFYTPSGIISGISLQGRRRARSLDFFRVFRPAFTKFNHPRCTSLPEEWGHSAFSFQLSAFSLLAVSLCLLRLCVIFFRWSLQHSTFLFITSIYSVQSCSPPAGRAGTSMGIALVPRARAVATRRRPRTEPARLPAGSNMRSIANAGRVARAGDFLRTFGACRLLEGLRTGFVRALRAGVIVHFIDNSCPAREPAALLTRGWSPGLIHLTLSGSGVVRDIKS